MAITRDLWLILRARDEASRIVRSFGNTLGGVSGNSQKQMTAFEQAVQTAAIRLDQFARTSMLVGTVMAGLGASGLAFIKSATDVAAEYDRQVRRTMTQIDGISISMEEIAEVGRRVAREVQIPFEQMQDTLFFIFSSMNVTVPEAEKLLRGFAKEAVAGQSTIEAAAKTTIAIMNSLGLSVKDLERIQDVQFQTVRKGIITYEELSNVIGRGLPATARAGQSFETLSAMIAFLTRNGLSAAMAATSAARALESFAHPTTVKRLEQMGIKVRDAKGEFLPLVQVMDKMNDKIKEMSAPQRAGFLQELFKGAGGTIQARRFWDVAFKNFGSFEEMIGHMSNATGVFEDAYATMAGSVAAQSELIRNKWMLIQEALGRAVMPHFLVFLKIIEKVLTKFDNLPEPVKRTIAQFILWGSVISIVVGVIIVLIGTLAFLVSSILAAGSALLIILGVIAGVTAGFIAFGTAVYLAWQRSEQFRKTVKDLSDILKILWDGLVSEVGKVKSSFESNLLPPLQRLWDAFNNKVLPAIREFMRIWREEALPKIQEGGRIISDLARTAFQYIGTVIDKIIIPAIQKMSEWWTQNSDKIRPLLSLAGQLVKWLLVIGAVILASPIIIFVSIIAGLILLINGLIIGIQKLWEILKTIGSAVGAFINELLGLDKAIKGIGIIIDTIIIPSAKKIAELWNENSEKLQPFIAAAKLLGKWLLIIAGIIIGLPLAGIIAASVAVIAVFMGIVAIVVNVIARIKEAFIAVRDFFIDLLTAILTIGSGILDFLKPILNSLFNFFKEIFGLILDVIDLFTTLAMEIFKDWIKPAVDFVIDEFNKLKDNILKILNSIYDNVIKPVLDLIKNLWNKHFKGMVDDAKGPIQTVVDTIKGTIDGLIGFFKDAGTWLLKAGRSIVQGLIDGITDSVKDLRKKLKEITDNIPNWKGPLTVDLNLLVPTGANIMKGLMAGIDAQVPVLRRQLQGITTQLEQIPAPSFATANGAPGIPPDQRILNQTINVYTQEINPRKNAAELGYELDGRL